MKLLANCATQSSAGHDGKQERLKISELRDWLLARLR